MPILKIDEKMNTFDIEKIDSPLVFRLQTVYVLLVRENNKCNFYEIVRPCFTINDAKEITTNR